MKLISCLIPSYNHDQYILSAIESVLNQTVPPLEIIILDDASHDNTKELLAPFKTNPKFNITINKQNKGVSRTFNDLAKQAKGDYIAYLPSDDMWEPDHLKLAQKAFETQPNTAFTWGLAKIITEDGPPQEYPWITRSPDNMFKRLLLGETNPIPFQSTVIKKDAFDRIGGFDEGLTGIQDYDLWLRLSANHTHRFIPHDVTKVRCHKNQVSFQTSQTSVRFRKERIIMLENAFIHLKKQIKEQNLQGEFTQLLAHYNQRMGKRLKKAGQIKEGAKHINRSLTLNPMQPKLWPLYLIEKWWRFF